MKKSIIITIVCVIVAAVIVVGVIFALPNPNYFQKVPYVTPAVTATSPPAHLQTSNPAVSPTKTPTLPVTPTVKLTYPPTPVSTPTISPFEQEGINKIVGNWYGIKSMIIGSARFSARFNSDHTASIVGKAEAMGETRDISLGNLVWRYEGNNQFVGTTNGKTVIFICDGNTLTTTINPHKLGSSGNSYLDQNIPVEMYRV